MRWVWKNNRIIIIPERTFNNDKNNKTLAMGKKKLQYFFIAVLLIKLIINPGAVLAKEP